jgi:DNA helicase-2/ATP-dependent DNA helicase PcrA
VFANGKGLKLYKAYQERLKILNAADFGDLCWRTSGCSASTRSAAAISGRASNSFWSTNIRTPTSRSICGCVVGAASQPAAERQGHAAERADAAPDNKPVREATTNPGRTPQEDPQQYPVRTRRHRTRRRRRSRRCSRAPARWKTRKCRRTKRARAARRADFLGIALRPLLENICCVGDDDQSIYGWRGAEVDNILRFEHDFPGAKVIRLERNYRSTGHILAAASHIIAHNEGRLGKTLRTDDELGEKVGVTGAWDSEEEARAIGEEIEQLQRGGHALNEIAILVRASFQMREFEDRFVTLGLPYRVIGGPRFYERAEIRDALAYLRVVNSPADDLAFERIVNVPKRGLGDATVQLLHDHARKRRVPLTEAARAMIETDELKPKPRGALRGVLESFDRWRKQRDTLPHTELAEIVLDESGYTEMWQKDRSADAAGRLENLKELIRSMEEFENLQGFLEHISLVMDNEKAPRPTPSAS